ncbi:MAG: autotransporter-associated beta strand repeat-containing protein [Thermoguttaceae bacterium]|nr:autotransporter-associated beta strand repeat-containing protein [Thermoguttaceae bacterium]
MKSQNYGTISSIRFGTSYGDVTGFLDNPQAGTFTGLAQRSIGLNFTGQNASGDSEKALATSDFAGADGYVQALWNNIRETTTTGVPYSMLDSVGSMEYYKNQSGYMTVGYTSESQSLDSLAGTDANSALMSGHANGATQVTLGAIPYDYYDVVVYMGDNADSIGQYWITDSEGNKISDTISVASGAFDGTWTQVKSSGDSGNYYVFRGLTTPSMILNSADGPINAVQIVGHNSTMYLADGDWSNELTVDGVAYQGVQFDSQTSADAKTASHAAGVVLNDNATFQVGNGYTLIQSAPITGTGSVDKTGEGTLVLSGANTYDGETNVYGGTLQLTGDAIDNANGSFTVGTGGTLEYNVASGDERTVVFTDATVIGNGDILKTGEGRLKINTDELDQATADLHFTADNFVVASGRLDLEGYMLGNIEVDANTVFSPGNSIGEATFGGGYILKDGATLLLEVGKDGDDVLTDVLNVTGDTTFEDGSIIKIALDSSYDNNFVEGDQADIQLPSGILGSDGNDLNLDNLVLQLGMFELVGYDSGTGILSVRLSAPAAGVPEPSTWALLILGAAGLLYVRKRTRK